MIEDGYRDAIDKGGSPYVLAERYTWLRQIAMSKLRDPVRFWQKIETCPDYRGRVPKLVSGLLHGCMPVKDAAMQMKTRIAGLGSLGKEQLEWLEHDVKSLKSSTPIVVFAHIPLWSIYPEWGWGTDDSAQALSYLKRFGTVSVLNGHIHQVMQKVEGNVTFHTAMSTAFPQPQPGTAPSPGPMKVPTDKLRGLLGLTNVNFVRGKHTLAVVDSTLQE